MENTVKPDEITSLTRKLSGLEREQNATLSKYDQAIKTEESAARPRPERLDDLRGKREAFERSYAESINRTRATLESKQSALREQQRAAAAQAEQAAKKAARRGFVGDDAQFEQAWPAIWARLQEDSAVNAGRGQLPQRPIVHL